MNNDTAISELDYNVTEMIHRAQEQIIAWSRGFIGDWFVEVKGTHAHNYIYTFINIVTGQWETIDNYSDAANFV